MMQNLLYFSIPVKSHIEWIDNMRGFCMLAIFWFHSEVYYIGFDKTPYGVYVGTVLALFFFISGYLFHYERQPKYFQKQLYKTLRTLIVPYFCFCTPIALIKLIVYETPLVDLTKELLTGHASWFIAALIMARLLLLLIMRISRENRAFLCLSAMFLLVLVDIFSNRESALCYRQDLWHINEGLLGCSFMIAGYLYRHHVEGKVSGCKILLVMAPFTLMTKYLIVHYNVKVIFGPVSTTCYPLFIIDLLCSISVLVALFAMLPTSKYIMWVGRHSLVFYFFCGACPLLASKLMNHIGLTYDVSSLFIIPVFLLATLAATFISAFCYRYLSIILTYKKI